MNIAVLLFSRTVEGSDVICYDCQGVESRKKYEFPCTLSLIETSSVERMNTKWKEGACSYMACHARSTVTSPSFSW